VTPLRSAPERDLPPVMRHHLGAVVFWMTGALLSFSVMAVSIRGLADTLNVFEMLTIRSACGLIVILALALWRAEFRGELAPRSMTLHALRNIPHFGGQYAWALAVTLLPLATVFTLEFTVPVWVALLAALFLGERMTVARIGGIMLGFVGVVVVVRPGFESFRPAALLVLFAAFGFAISLIATKKLTAVASTFAILFWMYAMQLPMALAGSNPMAILNMTQEQIPAAIGVGVSGLTSHYCLTHAFRFGEATVVVPIDFLRIPLIAVVGWLLYAEPPDAFVFAGAGLIIAGVLWNLLAESGRRRF
jgi:drug/metabolite transporter (DMT)-like permease